MSSIEDRVRQGATDPARTSSDEPSLRHDFSLSLFDRNALHAFALMEKQYAYLICS
jgi:hypothetical protein